MNNLTVCLIGSTRFYKEFNNEKELLVEQGCNVLMPSVFSKYFGYKVNENELERLVEESNQKIKDSDIVIVINKNGYIGKHTQEEINLANRLGKIIMYLE